MKKLLALVLALCMVVALCACGQQAAPTTESKADPAATTENKAPDTVYTMNIGSAMTDTHPVSIALETFKANVEARTNGGVIVNHHGNSTLGGEIELLEQNIAGTLEASMQMGAANFESYNGAADVALLPFLFSSVECAREAWGGAFGEKFANEIVAPTGVTALTFVESGMRHMTNNTRPIVEPEDLAGIKFRTNENNMKVKMYEALNGSVVMMPFSEVFTALQNGTIDGQENPLANIYSASLQEVQKYLSLTGHMYDAGPFVVNTAWFESLPAEYQQIIKEEALNLRALELELNDEGKYLDMLKEAGMEVNEVDTAAFQECMGPVWSEFESQYGTEWTELATSFNK